MRLDAGRKRVKDDARQSSNKEVVRLGRPAAWRKASPPAVTFAYAYQHALYRQFAKCEIFQGM